MTLELRKEQRVIVWSLSMGRDAGDDCAGVEMRTIPDNRAWKPPSLIHPEASRERHQQEHQIKRLGIGKSTSHGDFQRNQRVVPRDGGVVRANNRPPISRLFWVLDSFFPWFISRLPQRKCWLCGSSIIDSRLAGHTQSVACFAHRDISNLRIR